MTTSQLAAPAQPFNPSHAPNLCVSFVVGTHRLRGPTTTLGITSVNPVVCLNHLESIQLSRTEFMWRLSNRPQNTTPANTEYKLVLQLLKLLAIKNFPLWIVFLIYRDKQ